MIVVELSFIRWLRERTGSHPQAPLSIGDDAALLQLAAGQHCVVTTDMLMDGVDFRLAEADPRRVGRKALAVNLSDLAAMGAKSVAAFVSLALPRVGGEHLARELYEGILPLAAEFETIIAGGDTNSWDGPLVLSVTAIGEAAPGNAWRRNGARPGDWIVVTGQFGGSILGKHFDFTPRLREAAWLRDHAEVRAAIDVSDGLSLDLSRICDESGCGGLLKLDDIPISAAARQVGAASGRAPLGHALADGEDFELVMALAPAEAHRLIQMQPLGVPLTCIGRFVEECGLWTMAADGAKVAIAPRGYEHELT